jgi:hypothetical protein
MNLTDKIKDHLQEVSVDLEKELKDQINKQRQEDVERTQLFKAKAAKTRQELQHKERLKVLLAGNTTSTPSHASTTDTDLQDLVKNQINQNMLDRGAASLEEHVIEYQTLQIEGSPKFDNSIYSAAELEKKLDSHNGLKYLNLTGFSFLKALEILEETEKKPK